MFFFFKHWQLVSMDQWELYLEKNTTILGGVFDWLFFFFKQPTSSVILKMAQSGSGVPFVGGVLDGMFFFFKHLTTQYMNTMLGSVVVLLCHCVIVLLCHSIVVLQYCSINIKETSMYMLIHVRYCHRYQQQDNQWKIKERSKTIKDNQRKINVHVNTC